MHLRPDEREDLSFQKLYRFPSAMGRSGEEKWLWGHRGRPTGPRPLSGAVRGHILCRARRYPQDWRLKQRDGVSRRCPWGWGHMAADGGIGGTAPEQMGTQASPRMPKTGHVSVDGPSGATTTSVEDSGDRWQPRSPSTKAFRSELTPAGSRQGHKPSHGWKNPESTENTLNGWA